MELLSTLYRIRLLEEIHRKHYTSFNRSSGKSTSHSGVRNWATKAQFLEKEQYIPDEVYMMMDKTMRKARLQIIISGHSLEAQ